MTREEAIAVLRREIEPSVYEDEKSIAEAVDMAIEALQTDLVRCKDCIRNNDGNFCDIAFFINDDGDGFCNCGARREE